MGLLNDLVRRLFGASTEVRRNREDTTITTTASLIARQNPNRTQLVIANLGTSRIFVDSVETVSSSAGIPLDPGASMVADAKDDAEEVGASWWAVAATGTQTILVKETVGV